MFSTARYDAHVHTVAAIRGVVRAGNGVAVTPQRDYFRLLYRVDDARLSPYESLAGCNARRGAKGRRRR